MRVIYEPFVALFVRQFARCLWACLFVVFMPIVALSVGQFARCLWSCFCLVCGDCSCVVCGQCQTFETDTDADIH